MNIFKYSINITYGNSVTHD